VVFEALITSLLRVDAIADSLNLSISAGAASLVLRSKAVADSVVLVGLLGLWLLNLGVAARVSGGVGVTDSPCLLWLLDFRDGDCHLVEGS